MRVPIAFYPFYPEFLPIVKHFEEFQDKYTINKLVSPPGLSLTGRDAAYACNWPETGLIVTDILDMNDPTWDYLLLSKPLQSKFIKESHIVETMENALKAKKSVILTYYDCVNISDKISSLLSDYPGKITIHRNNTDMKKDTWESLMYKSLDVPVILVGGLTSEVDTSEVLMVITSKLRKDGLNVMAFTRYSACDFFNFFSTENIFNSFGIPDADIIIELNRYVKTLENRERPDIIIIEAPDAVMRFNESVPNGFGIKTYMLCQAVRPDYFICCIPCNYAEEALINMLSNDFAVRLGTPITATHISNISLDYEELMQSSTISCVRVNQEVVKRLVEKNCKSVIPMLDIINDGAENVVRVLTRDVIIKD